MIKAGASLDSPLCGVNTRLQQVHIVPVSNRRCGLYSHQDLELFALHGGCSVVLLCDQCLNLLPLCVRSFGLSFHLEGRSRTCAERRVRALGLQFAKALCKKWRPSAHTKKAGRVPENNNESRDPHRRFPALKITAHTAHTTCRGREAQGGIVKNRIRVWR